MGNLYLVVFQKTASLELSLKSERNLYKGLTIDPSFLKKKQQEKRNPVGIGVR